MWCHDRGGTSPQPGAVSHLWVFPFIAGSGEPLLPGIMTTHLDLVEVSEVGNGVVVLTYTPKREPRHRR